LAWLGLGRGLALTSAPLRSRFAGSALYSQGWIYAVYAGVNSALERPVFEGLDLEAGAELGACRSRATPEARPMGVTVAGSAANSPGIVGTRHCPGTSQTRAREPGAIGMEARRGASDAPFCQRRGALGRCRPRAKSPSPVAAGELPTPNRDRAAILGAASALARTGRSSLCLSQP
jgi:hypothetical protein